MTAEQRDYERLYHAYLERYVAQADHWERIFGPRGVETQEAQEAYRAENERIAELEIELLLHPASTVFSLYFSGFGEHSKLGHYDIDKALRKAFAPEQVRTDSESGEFVAYVRPEAREAVEAFLAQNFSWLAYAVRDVVADVRHSRDQICFALVPGAGNWGQARETLDARRQNLARRQILAGQSWPPPASGLSGLRVEASAENALEQTLGALREAGLTAMAEELRQAAAAEPQNELALCARYVRLVAANPDKAPAHAGLGG